METNDVIDRMFDGKDLNPATYQKPTTHRYTVFLHENNQVFGTGYTETEAHGIVDLLRASFGGTYDIIETETTFGDGKHLFSGEISKNLPHVLAHDPIVDPMSIEYYTFDMAAWITELVAERTPLSPYYTEREDSLPVAPTVRVRKPRRATSSGRERSFSGISDNNILMARGYVVIDLRSQERLFSGTKDLCKEYIEARNVARSRDKLPIEYIRVIKFSEYSSYQEEVEAHGKVVRYRGRTVLVGLQNEITVALRKMIKTLSNPGKYLASSDAGTADLWWVQNRFDGLRKVG